MIKNQKTIRIHPFQKKKPTNSNQNKTKQSKPQIRITQSHKQNKTKQK